MALDLVSVDRSLVKQDMVKQDLVKQDLVKLDPVKRDLVFLLPTITRKNMKEVTALEQEEPAVQHLLHLAVLPEDQPVLHQLTEASLHLDGSFWKTEPTSGSTMLEPPRKLEQAVLEQLIRGLPEVLLDQEG